VSSAGAADGHPLKKSKKDGVGGAELPRFGPGMEAQNTRMKLYIRAMVDTCGERGMFSRKYGWAARELKASRSGRERDARLEVRAAVGNNDGQSVDALQE